MTGHGDDSWRTLGETWERIRWARLHRTGFARPTDAARALDIRPGTYRTYELPRADGGRTPRLAELQRIGRRFGVSWSWLAAGTGGPDLAPAEVVSDEAQGLAARIAARLARLAPDRKAEVLRLIEAALQVAGPRRA